jgi:ubiquinone/menaquinone biosynthesis C-methylase UbiE
MSDAKLAHDTQELARRYDEISAERQFRSGKTLVAELEIKPGESELGCGTGNLQYFASP